MAGKWWISATCALMASPSHAAMLRIDFGGTFTGTYSTPAYPVGTVFRGAMTIDTAATASSVTTNPFGTFARFANVGTFDLRIGGDVFAGSVEALTSDPATGADNLRLIADIGNGYTFSLGYLALPASAINGAMMPIDVASYAGASTGSISNAQMRGNFGIADARASVISAIPEPTTWSAMVAGFALMGLIVRRRRVSFDAALRLI